MLTLDQIQRACDDAVLRAARQSQAALIATVDHLAHGSDGAPRRLGRFWALQLDVAALAPIDFARAIDEAYDHAQRLLSLHEQFVHRLYEAVDTRRPTSTRAEIADVIDLGPRLSSR